MTGSAVQIDLQAPPTRGVLRGRWTLYRLVALSIPLGLIVAFAAIRPGDAQFANDEPATVARALSALDAGRLADDGPIGLLGIEYGPVTTQFTQLLLYLTERDLTRTMSLRAILFMVASIGALLWLGRALRLSYWFVPVVLMAPPVWYHARLLWDNPWLLPLGAGYFAGYSQLLRGDRRIAPLAMGVCGTLLLLTHPMSAAMVLGVLVHALITQRTILRPSAAMLALGFLAASLTSVPYLQRTASFQLSRIAVQLGTIQPVLPPSTASPAAAVALPDKGEGLGRISAALYAWRGMALFSSELKVAEIPPASRAGRTMAVVRWTANIGTALFVLGTAFVLARRTAADPIVNAAGQTAVVVIAVQMVVFMFVRPTTLLHYHFGAAAATLLLCWIAADRALKRPTGMACVAIYGVSLAIATVTAAEHLHARQGVRRDYGPSLRQLTTAAETLARSGCVAVVTDIDHIKRFPGGLTVPLEMQLRDARSGGPARKIGVVRYASPDPADARLAVFAVAGPPDAPFEEIWQQANAGSE